MPSVGDVTNVTYNGVALTYSTYTVFSGEARVEFWYMLEADLPAAGTYTVAATIAGSATTFVHGASSWTGVHQTTPFGTIVTNTGSNSTPTVTVGSATGEIVHDFVASKDASGLTVDGSQDQRWNLLAGGQADVHGGGSSEAGDTNVVMSWSSPGAVEWAIIGVPMKPSGGGGANTAPTVAIAIADTTVNQDNAPIDNYRDLKAVFTDTEDGSALTYTILSNTNSGLVTPTLVAADSTLDLSFTASTSGTATITVRAADSGGLTVDDVFTVTVNGLPTVASAIADTTVNENNPAIDNYRDLKAVFTDVEDGSGLTYTIQSNTNVGLVTPTIVVADSTLDLSFTASTSGTATITVRATDSGSLFVDDVFTVTVNGTPTVASAIADTTVSENASPIDNYRDLKAVFTDAEDGSGLTYTIESNTNSGLVTPTIVAADSTLDLSFTASTSGVATVLDDQASPVNLTVISDTLAWRLDAGHRGLGVPVAGRINNLQHAGIASAAVEGTKNKTNLNGATAATFVVVAEWEGGWSDRMAGFQRPGGGRILLALTDAGGGLEFRTDSDLSNPRMLWPSQGWDDGVRRVFHFVYDTDHPTDSLRMRLYVDGVDQGIPPSILAGIPPIGDGLNWGFTDIELIALNEPDFTNGFPGSVFYMAVHDGVMTDAEITSDVAALLADDDNITYAVDVTLNGVDSLPRLPSNGTSYGYKYTVTNNSTVLEDFDLFGYPGDTLATFLTVDSIIGPNVTGGATADSARITGIPASGVDSAFVWYSVANVAAGTLETPYTSTAGPLVTQQSATPVGPSSRS